MMHGSTQDMEEYDMLKSRKVVFLHYIFERLSRAQKESQWIHSKVIKERILKEAAEAIAYWNISREVLRDRVVPKRLPNDWFAP